jgi:peptidoglycan hydrolase-like protein with peptidoglycan-binding domain
LSFRRLQQNKIFKIAKPALGKGSKGGEVIKLQKILNHLGYSCGDVDGYYGNYFRGNIKVVFMG